MTTSSWQKGARGGLGLFLRLWGWKGPSQEGFSSSRACLVLYRYNKVLPTKQSTKNGDWLSHGSGGQEVQLVLSGEGCSLSPRWVCGKGEQHALVCCKSVGKEA